MRNSEIVLALARIAAQKIFGRKAARLLPQRIRATNAEARREHEALGDLFELPVAAELRLTAS